MWGSRLYRTIDLGTTNSSSTLVPRFNAGNSPTCWYKKGGSTTHFEMHPTLYIVYKASRSTTHFEMHYVGKSTIHFEMHYTVCIKPGDLPLHFTGSTTHFEHKLDLLRQPVFTGTTTKLQTWQHKVDWRWSLSNTNLPSPLAIDILITPLA